MLRLFPRPEASFRPLAVVPGWRWVGSVTTVTRLSLVGRLQALVSGTLRVEGEIHVPVEAQVDDVAFHVRASWVTAPGRRE